MHLVAKPFISIAIFLTLLCPANAQNWVEYYSDGDKTLYYDSKSIVTKKGGVKQVWRKMVRSPMNYRETLAYRDSNEKEARSMGLSLPKIEKSSLDLISLSPDRRWIFCQSYMYDPSGRLIGSSDYVKLKFAEWQVILPGSVIESLWECLYK